MGKQIRAILFPKREGLTDVNKPISLLLHSPHDEKNASVDYKATAHLLTEIGYGNINKSKLTFGKIDKAVFDKAIKPVKMIQKQLTLWLESHGAPGWLFGRIANYGNEFKWTVHFAEFVRAIEAHTGSLVANIVLSGCFTANELVNEEGMTYLNSPARILSVLLPDKKILGFVGQNASAKVTNIYHKTKQGFYAPMVVNLDEAAILFQDGKVLESYLSASKHALFCNHKFTPEFVIDQCHLEFGEFGPADSYYQPCLAREKVMTTPIFVKPDCYGENQMVRAHETREPELSLVPVARL